MRNLAQFDITPYLTEGENVLAVEVYRNSDASFLESQDMFRLPGIYRDVYLTAKPKVQVRDIVCIPDYDATYTNATLNITAKVQNLDKKKIKDYTIDYALYENELYGESNQPVARVWVQGASDPVAQRASAPAKGPGAATTARAPGLRGQVTQCLGSWLGWPGPEGPLLVRRHCTGPRNTGPGSETLA